MTPSTARIPSASRLAVVALIALVSCFQGARAPNVQTRGVLGPKSSDAAVTRDGAFGVVFASPQGETVDPSEITVVFNRPVRPLDLAGDEQSPPVKISPPVRGAWRWVGTSAVVFAPEGHLPRATDYKITVPSGTSALDGSRLAQAYEVAFSTPAPSIVRSDPSDRSNHLTPQTKFTLRWNQPVADAEIARSLKIVAGDKKKTAVPFDVRHPDAQNPMLTELAPKAPLPTDSALEIVVDPRLTGTEGPRPAGQQRRLAYRTYGPLVVQELTCDRDTPHKRCSAASEVSLRLSNEVKIKDLQQALVIDPPVALKWGDREEGATTSWLTLDGHFTPAKSFTVRLRSTIPGRAGTDAALRDAYGQPLARDWSTRLELDDLWPKAEIGVQGTYLEAEERRDVPVLAVNVREMQVAAMALRTDDVFALSDAGEENAAPPWQRLIGAGAKAETWRPSAPKNAVFRKSVRGDDWLGKGRRGPIAVGVAYTERPGTPEAQEKSGVRVVQITDLGISAKVSSEGTLVWVTRLSSGAPVQNASVEIKRSPRAGGDTSGTFATDADGFAVIPKERFTPHRGGPETATLFVRLGDDWAYRHVTDVLSGWRFGASVESGDDEAPIGMIFTERGIYRPGDSVKVKGIVREPRARGTATPVGKEVRCELKGPEGEKIIQQKGMLNAYGTFSFDFKVPDAGKVGSYSLSVNVGERSSDWGDLHGSFEVAEYRPAEFKVSAEAVFPPGAVAARQGSYVRGDKASWNLSGQFLFGAPMSKADVRYTVTREPSSFAPPLPDGFVTGERRVTADLPDASPRSREVLNGRASLDSKGALSISSPLSMPGQVEAERVICEAEVTDISRQSIAGSTSSVVHPAEFYVALKPGVEFFTKPNVAARPEVLAVDPRGVKRAQVPVHVDLVKRTFSLARQAGGGGGLHSVVSTIDKVIQSCDLVTADAPAACSLTPVTSGYYLLHATAKDNRGNKVGAASSFYVMGEGDVSWGDSDDQRLELVADRETYEPGQTAHVLVKSPFKVAEALVTVERAGVLSRRRIKLAGATPTIDVPITEDLRPNAFVSVLILRGRTKPVPSGSVDVDVGAPTFRLGYATLLINPEARRLKVAVKANKDKLLPGEQVEVDVDVRDQQAKGTKSEVTLYAVDEGVLSLIDYKTPDPIPVFSAPRALRVSTVESREALASQKLAESGAITLAGALQKGLEGGGGGDSVRRDFRQSVYFNPSLVTDAAGHAHATFKLPDSLTTYRIMAIAVAEDDRFGSAETSITASRPLMARPAFPRILRAGDSIDAGIVLTSKGLARTSVEIEVAAAGITLASPQKQTVTLEADSSTEVRFSFKAEQVGQAKISFRAKGGGASDAVEIVRTVSSPASPEAVALYGDTTSAAGEKLGDLSSLRGDIGGLEVSLSSTALVGLGGGVEQLIEYPYGCTEQLTSRLLPLLPLRDLARDFHIPLPPDVDGVVAKTVAQIVANQRADGGFGLFADSSRSLPWVSAYALWGLGEAARRKVHVPESSLEQATRYVQGQLSQWQKDEMSAATAAFVVDVLAENGAPAAGWTERLFEDRQKLPLFAEALLLHAMAIGKGDSKSIAEMTRELEGHLRIDGPVARAVDNTGDRYAALMDSEARTSALVLRALLAASPAHPMAARLAMGLLADRQGGTWRSTQETAWALLALDAYRRAQERSEPSFDARAFVGDTQVLAGSFHGRSATSQRASIPAARVQSSGGSTLAFEIEGTGRLFYEARLRYAKKELPTAPLDRGFFVKKVMRALRPEDLAVLGTAMPARSSSAFSGGELVLVDLAVVAPSPRQFVAIDDPLPAGLEPVDAALRTTAASLAVGPEGDTPPEDPDDDQRAIGEEYLSSAVRREMRDDRVLFFVEHMAAGMYHYRYLARATTLGRFVLPPTRAEEMYAPEVFGRTAAATVEIGGAGR